MDKEVIDRLMIDRAVGVLDPDVEELLRDFLARNRDIEERYLATAEVIELSRTVLRSEDKTMLPDFRVPQEFEARRRRIVPLQIIGIAAALLACFFMGRQFPNDGQLVSRPAIAFNVAAEQSTPKEGMWTIARTRMQPKAPIRSTSWKWTSPVRQPEPVNKGELL